MLETEKYRDFRGVMQELVDRRVRLSFFLDTSDGSGKFTAYGWIRKVSDHSLVLENDPQSGDLPLTVSHFNLGAIVIYAVDEVPEDADLSEKEEPDVAGLATEYIPYDKDGKPEREPQPGYVILHKDHIYAKGTVYTKIKEEEKKEGEE